MPIYEYKCLRCKQEFEELIRGSEEPCCPHCGSQQLERCMSVAVAHSAGNVQSSCPASKICGQSTCCDPNCRLGRL